MYFTTSLAGTLEGGGSFFLFLCDFGGGAVGFGGDALAGSLLAAAVGLTGVLVGLERGSSTVALAVGLGGVLLGLARGSSAGGARVGLRIVAFFFTFIVGLAFAGAELGVAFGGAVLGLTDTDSTVVFLLGLGTSIEAARFCAVSMAWDGRGLGGSGAKLLARDFGVLPAPVLGGAGPGVMGAVIALIAVVAGSTGSADRDILVWDDARARRGLRLLGTLTNIGGGGLLGGGLPPPPMAEISSSRFFVAGLTMWRKNLGSRCADASLLTAPLAATWSKGAAPGGGGGGPSLLMSMAISGVMSLRRRVLLLPLPILWSIRLDI